MDRRSCRTWWYRVRGWSWGIHGHMICVDLWHPCYAATAIFNSVSRPLDLCEWTRSFVPFSFHAFGIVIHWPSTFELQRLQESHLVFYLHFYVFIFVLFLLSRMRLWGVDDVDDVLGLWKLLCQRLDSRPNKEMKEPRLKKAFKRGNAFRCLPSRIGW